MTVSNSSAKLQMWPVSFAAIAGVGRFWPLLPGFRVTPAVVVVREIHRRGGCEVFELLGEAVGQPVNRFINSRVVPLNRSTCEVQIENSSMQLTCGGPINFSRGSINTAGGNLLVAPGASWPRVGFTEHSAGVNLGSTVVTLSFSPGTQLSLQIDRVFSRPDSRSTSRRRKSGYNWSESVLARA